MKTTRKPVSKTKLKAIERASQAAADFVALTNQARDIAERLKMVKAELEAFAIANTNEFEKHKSYQLGAVVLKWGEEGSVIEPEKLDMLAFAKALPQCVKIVFAKGEVSKMTKDADKRRLLSPWGVDYKTEPKLKIEIA